MKEFTVRQSLRDYDGIEPCTVAAHEVEKGDVLITRENLDRPDEQVLVRLVDRVDHYEDHVDIFTKDRLLFSSNGSQRGYKRHDELLLIGKGRLCG
jgi:hypothetical protein